MCGRVCVSKLCTDELCLWVRCVGVRVCVCVCEYVCVVCGHDQRCPTPGSAAKGNRCVTIDYVSANVQPRLPRKPTVDVSLCHACHAKCRGVTGAQASPSAPPSDMSATPATQNDGRCDFVPRLPRETTVDVRLCHACHAKWRSVTGAQSRPKGATQYHLCHACHAKRR